MEKTTKQSIWAKIALFTATLIWGSTFFIMKNTLDSIPPYFLLAVRFLMATVVLSVIFCKKFKMLNKTYLWQGAVLGVIIAVAYTIQTIGLKYTTPGKNAFLTAVYCVLVPFFAWMFFKERPDKFNFIAAITCFVGIGFVSLDGEFTIQFGDYMTLISGVFYGLYIVTIKAFNNKQDPILLTIVQFFVASIVCWILSFSFETIPNQIPTGAWGQIVYLAMFGTATAMLLQNVGQKYTTPSASAIILSTEALFGALFSVLFYHEVITFKLFVGFLLIFSAVFVSETKLQFLFKNKQKKQNQKNTANTDNLNSQLRQ